MPEKSKTASARTNEFLEDAANRVSDISDRVQSVVSEMNREVASRASKMNVGEATIPDAFRNAPKLISPRVHSFLDAAVAGYFLVLGGWFASRRKKGPATAAFINAGMVATVSAMTDYDGSGKKPISFKLHCTLDAIQATTAALGPAIHGFAGRREAAFFYGQAADEVGVIAFTDWDAGMPTARRRKAA